ncbi:MAG: phosphoethanolamine transferase [Acidobacteriota bacterium]
MKFAEKRRLRVSHARFSVLFCVLLYWVCNVLNVEKLAQWFPQRGSYDLTALAAYLVAGQCLFLVFFVLLAHRWTIKPLAIFLLAASAPATYFISKYDVAIDSSMILNTIHTDSTEVGQLLSVGMVPYALLLVAVPVMAILPLEITFASAGRYLLQSVKLVVAALAVAVLALYSEYNAIHRAGNVSNKYIVYSLVPVNVISGTLSAAKKLAKPYLGRRKVVEIAGRVTRQDDVVVVLAIGEASRRSNFSLYGYERRETNPILRATGGLHLLDGIARRGSTLNALPEILARDDVKLPQVATRLGVPTACYVNYTLYDNCAEPGETRVSNCGHEGRCYDEDVIPLLERDLAAYRSGPRLVVLFLGGGSHGPIYRDRHPPEFARFEPGCADADIANRCSLEQIYNSYDNTILYVDFVVGEILAKLEKSGVPYVFIYLSDHGESLMEEGRMFHGMPPGIPLPPEQAEIPLIVKASVPVRVVERDEYRQQDVFDTVLDLLSIESPVADRSRSFVKREVPPAPAAN